MLPEIWHTAESGSEASAVTAELDFPVIREFLLVHRRRYGTLTRADTVESSVFSEDYVSCQNEPTSNKETPHSLSERETSASNLNRNQVFEDSPDSEILAWPVDQIARFLLPPNPSRNNLGHQLYTVAHNLSQIIENGEVAEDEEFTTATLHREFSFISGYQTSVENFELSRSSHAGPSLNNAGRYAPNRNSYQDSSRWSLVRNFSQESAVATGPNGSTRNGSNESIFVYPIVPINSAENSLQNSGGLAVALSSARSLTSDTDSFTESMLAIDAPLAEGHPQDLVGWLSAHFKKQRNIRPPSIDGIIMSHGVSRSFQNSGAWYKPKKWIPLKPSSVTPERNRNIFIRMARKIRGRQVIEPPRSFYIYRSPGNRFSGYN